MYLLLKKNDNSIAVDQKNPRGGFGWGEINDWLESFDTDTVISCWMDEIRSRVEEEKIL